MCLALKVARRLREVLAIQLPLIFILGKTQLKILCNYPFNVTERGCPAAALRVWPWKDIGRTPIGKSPISRGHSWLKTIVYNHKERKHIKSYYKDRLTPISICNGLKTKNFGFQPFSDRIDRTKVYFEYKTAVFQYNCLPSLRILS